MPGDRMTRCEQRRQFVINDVTEWRWKDVSVPEAIMGAPAQIRCSYCHGEVRIHRQQVPHGPQDHVEHLSRQDSEFCEGGSYFTGEHRRSTRPVE